MASNASAGTAGAAVGDFAAFPDPAITAQFVWWDTIDGRGTGEACATRGVDPAALAGKIALVKRGACTFTTKVRAAESLGAIGTVVFNNVAGDPTAMAHDGTEPFPAIPAVMVGNAYGTALSKASGTNLTIGGPQSEQSGTADILAGFSSRGPANTPAGLIVKPDMTAPGVKSTRASRATTRGAASPSSRARRWPLRTWRARLRRSSGIGAGRRPSLRETSR